MSNHQRIEMREARLLRWESYIRRTRHVTFWLGVLAITMLFFLGMIGEGTGGYADDLSMLWVGVFLLAVAYETHLKVRHIDSIKYHRSNKSEPPQT
jgi:hypothetical protein